MFRFSLLSVQSSLYWSCLQTSSDYSVLFEDTSYPEGYSPPLSVAQRYVIACRDDRKKWPPISCYDRWLSCNTAVMSCNTAVMSCDTVIMSCDTEDVSILFSARTHVQLRHQIVHGSGFGRVTTTCRLDTTCHIVLGRLVWWTCTVSADITFVSQTETV